MYLFNAWENMKGLHVYVEIGQNGRGSPFCLRRSKV